MSKNSEIEIEKILNEELKLAREAVEEAAQRVGKKTVERLKATSPKRKRKGKYARSWKLKSITLTRNNVAFVIHNSPHAPLTHLLEKGHAIVQGKGGWSPAIPHIAPAEEAAIDDFEKELTQIIERG